MSCPAFIPCDNPSFIVSSLILLKRRFPSALWIYSFRTLGGCFTSRYSTLGRHACSEIWITEFIHRFPPLGWRCVAAGWRLAPRLQISRRPCLAPRGLFAKMSRRWVYPSPTPPPSSPQRARRPRRVLLLVTWLGFVSRDARWLYTCTTNL